ncbi:LPS translocon maturation chaperone LptM [Legionella bononiensis]|uniref:Lipoprotein n=1 Tax=Legionella bononiensis TaxID=2793102 RepID=A0ABS1W9D7_9GAMM|nr:lipoprotein [Legionella bononiensis]MBL7480848.1 lipoprotein [Legionella bononiensis]MBL7525970.1 lipoprotein [Legionella bononiensis]MBL7563963.1 lipoprotein [Legionella bononiensis]
MTRYFALLVCATVLFLTACGQKGPLYLPAPETATPTAKSS